MVKTMKSILDGRFIRNISFFEGKSQINSTDSLPKTQTKNKNIYHSQPLLKINKKDSFQEKKYIILLLLLYITFFTSLSICKKVEFSLINNDNYITLIIKGEGYKDIISPKYGNYPNPESVLLNGVDQIKDNRTLYIPEGENTIKISWGETKITTCYQMFEDLTNITSIDFSNFDFSEVKTIQGICQGCEDLETVVFKNEVISNQITSFDSAFLYCKKLKSITNIGNLDSSKVKSMVKMFAGCEKLESLDLTKFNTASVNSTQYMFDGCKTIQSLDLHNFDTSSVTNMERMFHDCESLISLDVSGSFNTELVETMNDMFAGCRAIPSLDLSNFRTPSLKTMSAMFYACEELVTLDVRNFNTTLVTTMNDMFAFCKKIKSLDFSHFYTPSLVSMWHMFYGCEGLIFLDLSHFNTSKVTAFDDLFNGCQSLPSLDLRNFDTSSAINMNAMFYACRALVSLDISSFDTRNVERMSHMFRGCNSITSLDLKHFVTPKLLEMANQFHECHALEYLDISNFNTEKVTNLEYLFCGCNKLQSININNFNTNRVTNMQHMFQDCSSLNTLLIDNLNTELVTNMEYMFANCAKLISLDLTHFKTESLTNILRMFADCIELKYLDVSSFNTLKVTNFDNLFRSTRQLIALNLLNFDILNDTNVREILLYVNPDVILCYNESRVSYNFTYIEAKDYENSCKAVCILNSRKYILDIEKCVLNCENEEVYNKEYEDICYKNCPGTTELKTDSTYLCEECRNYFKYDLSGCLDELPDGYYRKDLTTKVIEICPEKCAKCTYQSIVDNNNICETCKSGYYPKEGDENNQNGFINCYNEAQPGYYLDNDENKYKQCYSSCEECNGSGDADNNHCTTCKNSDIYKVNSYDNCVCINYYNFEKTQCEDSIPPGYYNDDEEKRTIAQCPEKCKTCSYASIITNNNLCISCNINDEYYPKEDESNPNGFFECYKGDQIGYYLDTEHNIFKTCDSKCQTCSLESTNNGKCTSCNIADSFYPKSPENTNSIYDCYQEEQIGYFLDNTEKIIKPCYSTCKYCSQEGTWLNNYCTECIDDTKYVLKTDRNCICINYFNLPKTDCIDSVPPGYYNDDEEKKTIAQCPEKCKTCSYASIITNNNLCESCNNDNEYYSKEDESNSNSFFDCYKGDQSGYYLDANDKIFRRCYSICEECNGNGDADNNHCTTCKDNTIYKVNSYNNCVCINYYDFPKTQCIGSIPSGYYNDDVEKRTIAQCPEKCKTCSYEGIIENNNLCDTCNIDEGYYPKYNDPVNINPFYECYNTEQTGYYLDTEAKIFMPCYSKCKKCSGEGNDENNNCLECKDDDIIYTLTDGNCIYEGSEFRYSYDVDSVSEETKNDYTHTFIDMSADTVSHLKEIFSLGESSKIYVKIVENEESNVATADYTYEYILENGTKLNLDDIEEDLYVDIYVPLVDLNESNFELAKQYAELGYDIYNLHSKFYTDFCTPVSLNGNDVPLAERKKEIYPNNITLCKDNCIYKGINLDERRVICKCNLNNKTNDENLVQEDETFEAYFIDNINYRLFLCYKLFFNVNYIKNSYAFFTILIIFVLVIIFDFIFLKHSLENLKSFLIKQMPSYNKLYKEIFSESKKIDDNDNINNINSIVDDGIIANPLKKDLEKSKNKKKKRKSTKSFRSIKLHKKLSLNIAAGKYENINNMKTEEPFNTEMNEEKKEKKRRKSKKFNSEYNEKTIEINEKAINKNEENKEEEDLNELPYSKAIELDKRNIFQIYFSFLVEKLDFISVFCTNTKLRIILIIEFILSLLVNFFLNALLYSDDIVSHKYHNNGELDFAVSLALSIISNVVTSIICYYLKYSKGIDDRIDLILEIKRDIHYFKNIKRLLVYLKRKFICFFISQIIVFATCIYYIEIFCVKLV